MNLIKSNTLRSVEVTTKAALRKLPDVEKALDHLTGLKGIGPATASGKSIFFAGFCAGIPCHIKTYVNIGFFIVDFLLSYRVCYRLVEYIFFLDFQKPNACHCSIFVFLILGILAALNPDTPFMADEAMLCIPGLEDLEYTRGEFIFYKEKVQECLARLRKEGKYKLDFICLTAECLKPHPEISA